MYTIIAKTELGAPEYVLNIDLQFAGEFSEVHDCLAEALSSALSLDELKALHEKLGVIVSDKIEAKEKFYQQAREIANKRFNEMKSSGYLDAAIECDTDGALVGVDKFKKLTRNRHKKKVNKKEDKSY